MDTDPDQLAALIDAIQKSAKYRHISPDLIRHLGAAELAKRPKLKDAIKATKNKLHQTSAVYLANKMPYNIWLDDLHAAEDDATRRAICEQSMAAHASTRERLPILAEFYTTLLADLPPIQHVIDIACGLNPLAWSWMALDAKTSYLAYDVHGDMIDFLNGFFDLMGINGRAHVMDVTQTFPEHRADLALVLKTLPCLEQIDKSVSLRLLEGLRAEYLIVSYPVQSLGGRHKNMTLNYEASFMTLIQGQNWTVQRHLFETELAFVVRK